MCFTTCILHWWCCMICILLLCIHCVFYVRQHIHCCWTDVLYKIKYIPANTATSWLLSNAANMHWNSPHIYTGYYHPHNHCIYNSIFVASNDIESNNYITIIRQIKVQRGTIIIYTCTIYTCAEDVYANLQTHITHNSHTRLPQ